MARTQEEMALLNRALGDFNDAASALSGFYDRLTREITTLNVELEEKNLALAESLTVQKQTKDFLTLIMDSLTTGVLVLDEEGRVSLANEAAARLLGMSMTDLSMAAVEDLLPGQELKPSTLGNIPPGGRDYRVARGAGGRTLSCTFSSFVGPVHGEKGAIGLIRDVTDELIRGAQRERTQVLTAMGEMAAEVAHQLRNPLGGIELFASILGREVAGEENLENLVSHISSGVQRANHLISNYLALARPPRPVKAPVRLDLLLAEALETARPSMEKNRIKALLKAERPPTWVKADGQLMLQVFMNVILNAVEAIENGGVLTVELSRGADGMLETTFRDTGCGIGPEELDRVFNPFFTTKGKSLGLGLAVSHLIVDAHKGLIQITSRPGEGTLVKLALPAMPRENDQALV